MVAVLMLTATQNAGADLHFDSLSSGSRRQAASAPGVPRSVKFMESGGSSGQQWVTPTILLSLIDASRIGYVFCLFIAPISQTLMHSAYAALRLLG